MPLARARRYRGRVRKFLLSPGIWSAIFPAIGLARSSKNGPRDWRLVLLWLSLGIGIALAVGDVLEKSRQAEIEELEQRY